MTSSRSPAPRYLPLRGRPQRGELGVAEGSERRQRARTLEQGPLADQRGMAEHVLAAEQHDPAPPLRPPRQAAGTRRRGPSAQADARRQPIRRTGRRAEPTGVAPASARPHRRRAPPTIRPPDCRRHRGLDARLCLPGARFDARRDNPDLVAGRDLDDRSVGVGEACARDLARADRAGQQVRDAQPAVGDRGVALEDGADDGELLGGGVDRVGEAVLEDRDRGSSRSRISSIAPSRPTTWGIGEHRRDRHRHQRSEGGGERHRERHPHAPLRHGLGGRGWIVLSQNSQGLIAAGGGREGAARAPASSLTARRGGG